MWTDNNILWSQNLKEIHGVVGSNTGVLFDHIPILVPRVIQMGDYSYVYRNDVRCGGMLNFYRFAF